MNKDDYRDYVMGLLFSVDGGKPNPETMTEKQIQYIVIEFEKGIWRGRRLMLIKWKPLKFKHTVRAQEIRAGILDKTATDTDLIEFVLSLVESWDLIDTDTGQIIPLADYAEMTVTQFNELMHLFNEQMAGSKVKKTNNAQSSYSSNGSKTVKRATTSHAVRPTG